MAEENVRFKFDLDAKDAVKTASSLHEKIMDIGDSKNLKGLVEGFTAVSGPIFVAGAALLTVKKLMDFTVEGESLMKIRKNFEDLTTQFQLDAPKIEAGLDRATKGTVDMDEAMKSANKAMTLLGSNANKLPQTMELARAAFNRGFGQDILSNFESINAAIAAGNTRTLRQIGIIVDADKAYKDYAKSIGTVAGMLSEQGRQAALLDAVLKKGNERFKGSDGEGIKTFTEALKFMTEAIKDAYDAFTIFIAKNYGEFFRDAALGVGRFIKELTGTSTAADNVAKLEREIEKLQIRFNQLSVEQFEREDRKGVSGFFKNFFSGEGLDTVVDQNLRKVKEMLAAKREELAKLQGEAAPTDSTGAGPSPDGMVDKDKQAVATAQFHRQLLQLRESRLAAEMAIETNALEFEKDLILQKTLLAEQYDARIAELKAKAAKGDEITAQQAAEMIAQIEREKIARIDELVRDQADKQQQVYDNQVKAAKTAADGMAAAFKQAGMQAQRDLENYGKQGQAAFNIVNNASKRFFIGLGEGSKDASQLMREFLFGVLADYAEQQGSVLLMEGIGLYDGVKIAQGGALLALSGLLRSMAGGGGGSAGGAGGGAGAASPNNPALEKPTLDEDKKKSVTIQVQGNYFETEQTKTRLVEMIRETNDATDYKIQQIGVK